MSFWARRAVWLLPMTLLAGCMHKSAPSQAQVLAPPVEDQPLPAPSNVAAKDLPPPVVGDSTTKQPEVQPTPAIPELEKKPVHHTHKKPSVDEARNNAAPSVSAIGQLSQGASGDARSDAAQVIDSVGKGLDGVTRSLSASESKTAAQIREFLKQAHEALDSGDVDGARTLAEKARVLLAELKH